MSQVKALSLYSAPAAAVLTTAEAKAFLRVDTSSDDTLIDSLVAAATQKIEFYLNRKLITQTWDLYMDNFPMSNNQEWWDGSRDGHISSIIAPRNYIDLMLAPVSSISHLKTFDNDDASYTMTASQYYVDTIKGFGRLYLRLGQTWPTTVLRTGNGIQIRMVVGYGSSSASVPTAIIAAIREMLVPMYDCRGASEIAMSAVCKSLLEPYRIMNI